MRSVAGSLHPVHPYDIEGQDEASAGEHTEKERVQCDLFCSTKKLIKCQRLGDPSGAPRLLR